MSLWDNLLKLFRDTAPRYKTPVLVPSQVDRGAEAAPVAEGKSYLRLWLVEMCLAEGVDWFQHRYPVVYAATTYQYGGKPVTVPFIAGADYFSKLTPRNLDRVVNRSFELTPFFPFVRGVVEFKAALFSMKTGEPLVGAFVESMGQFAKLLPVPELSAVVKLAEQVNSGIQSLFNSGDGQMELGYQQTFAPAGGNGANVLQPGYFAAVLGTKDDFEDKDLRVINDVLHLARGGGKPVPLSGYSYMLFRLEKRDEQDWEALAAIKDLVARAQDALQQGKQDEARQILGAVKIAILRSPDVVKADRMPMFGKIEAELRELGLEGKRTATAVRSLHAIMQRAMPAATDQQRSEWERLEQVLSPDGPDVGAA